MSRRPPCLHCILCAESVTMNASRHPLKLWEHIFFVHMLEILLKNKANATTKNAGIKNGPGMNANYHITSLRVPSVFSFFFRLHFCSVVFKFAAGTRPAISCFSIFINL